MAERWHTTERRFSPALHVIFGALSAELVIFAGGALWFWTLTHYAAATILAMSVFPFLPGEAIKLALACALVHEPPLLFLDEPTSGLDPVHRQQMWNLLYDLSNRGITIFVTTHYMDEAERCTEVGFIERGRLLAKASPRALKESFHAKLLEIDVEPVMPALVRLRDAPGILGVSLRSGSLRLYAVDAEKLVAEWRKEWPFPDIRWLGERWVEPDMEDVFTAYSQGYDAMLRPAQS